MRASVLRAILAGQILAAGVAAYAEDPSRRFHLFARHHQKKEGTPPPGEPRFIPHTDDRGATRERRPVTWSRARRPAESVTMSAVASRSAMAIARVKPAGATRGPGAGTKPVPRISDAA